MQMLHYTHVVQVYFSVLLRALNLSISHGFMLFILLVGIIIAGSPISYVAETWDWTISFVLISVMILVAFMLLVIGKDIQATYLQDHTDGPPKLSMCECFPSMGYLCSLIHKAL